MFRFLIPTILIVVAIAGFFLFTNPLYHDITALRTEVVSYNQALDNSKALENERDKLTKKYNSIDPQDLVKIQKFLPDNVDNIRLILEIEKVAMPFGMALRDVKYDTTTKNPTAAAVQAGSVNDQSDRKSYGTWTLEFSTQGTYNNFLDFLHALETNLRAVDVSSIEFSSDAGGGLTPSVSDVYKYSFKIQTYWLKN